MFQQNTNTHPQKQIKNDLIGSVQRALHMMDLLARYPAGLNPKQIGLKLELNVSTCYHLLNTLAHEGYIVKDPVTHLFRLSGKIGYTAFAQASPAQLVKQLTPHVQSLQETTQETAYLSIWNGLDITLSAIAEAPQAVQVKSLTIGYTEANHATALGKSILAYLSVAQVDHYFSERALPAYTANTITTLSPLKDVLARIRQQGYSLDFEEFLPEVHCISAPIFDAHDRITAAIAISLPAARSEKNTGWLIERVKEAGAAASRALQILGYVSPPGASFESMG